jgi:glycosyltransferase involved in cell wall biosynthesis
MTAAKKILLISGFRIFPSSTGGHLRTGNIARGLARMGHEVCVYSLAGRGGDYPMPAVLKTNYRIDQIEPNLVEETNLGLGFGLSQAAGRRLGLPRVWQYALLRMGWVPARLRKAIREADLVFSDLPWCPPVSSWYRRKPWYLISHNLEFRLLEQGTRLDRMAAGWMRAVETAAPANYRDILACAEEDQAYFRQHDARRQLVVPVVRNGVDPAVYVAAAGVREQTRAQLGLTDSDHLLVFSGSNFGPNLEALETLKAFCRKEAEFLAQARIYILALGSMVRQPFKEGALIATGRVPEVLPYFAAGDAGFNPVIRGSGANVKLFEYLAARLPVISTAFGVRGTTLIPNDDFVLVEDGKLKQALQQFVSERTREEWRLRAEQVWQRQRGSCDIEAILREVVQQLPAFAAA